MDFHAYCEVYLGQDWFTFDPRYNVPRIGRVKVAHGSDAVDGAFATIYGEANLTHFEVWAYQVNPLEFRWAILSTYQIAWMAIRQCGSVSGGSHVAMANSPVG